MSSRVYREQDIAELEELIRAGVTLLCPKCHAELLVILNLDAAKKHRKLRGVYCTQNADHFYQVFFGSTATQLNPE